MEVVAAGQQRVVLESVCPAMGVLVVRLQKIVVLDLLPLVQGLGGDDEVGQSLGEQMQQHCFSTADVAFDRIDYLLH